MTSAISKRAFVQSQVAEVDLAVARVQEAARDSLQRVIDGGLLKGRLIEAIAIDAGGVSIAHGLGRRPMGWLVADLNTNAFVYRTAWDARTITLFSSKAAAISVWVF